MNQANPVRADKVVVVDDDARIRDLLRRYLSQEGFEVMVAEDGKNLNRILQREAVDLIVLDLMLPGEDGLSLLKKLKNSAKTREIPVIMVTAKGAEYDKVKGLDLGADDYISKPFNMEMLLLKVRHLIEMKKKMQKAFMQSSTMGIALTEVQASSMDEELMRKAIAYIEEQIANPELSVERLSREMGMSRVNFYKKCLSITGKTPVELIRTVRLKRAAQLLEKSQMRVNEVALECGFNDVKLFRKYFKDEFGRLPSDYHK